MESEKNKITSGISHMNLVLIFSIWWGCISIKKWLGAFWLIATVILLSRLDSIIFKVIKSDSPILKEITIDLANELLFVIAFLMYSNVVNLYLNSKVVWQDKDEL